MELVISDYKIESDGSCVTLYKKRAFGPKSKKAGQYRFDVLGYYANLGDALSRLMEERIADGLKLNVAALGLRIDAAKQEILDALAGLEGVKWSKTYAKTKSASSMTRISRTTAG